MKEKEKGKEKEKEKEEEKEEEKEKEKGEEKEKKGCKLEKCEICNKDSINKNLCIKCNNNKGYYFLNVNSISKDEINDEYLQKKIITL